LSKRKEKEKENKILIKSENKKKKKIKIVHVQKCPITSTGFSVVEITRELNKKPSLHCYLIYISYKWSVLQQYVYLMSTL